MLIIFTGISTNTINLINNNSQFEYILFDQKEDTIFENEENFIVIYEEDYLEINNLLKLKKSKKQIYFIGIFKSNRLAVGRLFICQGLRSPNGDSTTAV